MNHEHDVLILGSGAAGLVLALALDSKLKVAVLSKGKLNDGSTYRAQGGISAVLAKEDSFASHIEDTINAGAGLCKTRTVEFVIKNAPTAIDNLIEHGVHFTEDEKTNNYHLTREGGHSHRRVIHAEDKTGEVVENQLEAKARRKKNLQIFEQHIAIDLVTDAKLGGADNKVHGVYVLNIEQDQVDTFKAKVVVLATGGASKVYLYSSNPDGSTGDGIAMAWRAGCKIANMEFNQFHPTCLYHPHAKSFLITEAVRGEGGKLLLPDGTRFMQEFDKRQELAPRDIVARAIDHKMKRLGIDSVFLDISFKDKKFIKKHFPTVSKQVKKFGFNMDKEPLPVVPAAHYTCGGIQTDLSGKTTINGLFAIGECASTGLHGANRMASNSLLECLVFAQSAADEINAKFSEYNTKLPKIPPWDASRVSDSDEMVVVSHNWDEIRRFMWDYVGIVRTDKRLARAKNRIELLRQEIQDYYSNFKVHHHLLELRNLAQVAELIIDSAMLRKESRGLHYNLDYPDTQKRAKDVVLQRKDNRLQ